MEELFKKVLDELYKGFPEYVSYHKLLETGISEKDYSYAVSFLRGKGYISGKDNKEKMSPISIPYPTITSLGIEFLQNGCKVVPQEVSIRISKENMREILIQIAEIYGKDEQSKSKIKAFASTASDTAVNTLTTKMIESALSNIDNVLAGIKSLL